MTWWVELSGDEVALRRLQVCLKREDHKVIEENGKFYLLSEDFNDSGDEQSIRKIAELLLEYTTKLSGIDSTFSINRVFKKGEYYNETIEDKVAISDAVTAKKGAYKFGRRIRDSWSFNPLAVIGVGVSISLFLATVVTLSLSLFSYASILATLFLGSIAIFGGDIRQMLSTPSIELIAGSGSPFVIEGNIGNESVVWFQVGIKTSSILRSCAVVLSEIFGDVPLHLDNFYPIRLHRTLVRNSQPVIREEKPCDIFPLEPVWYALFYITEEVGRMGFKFITLYPTGKILGSLTGMKNQEVHLNLKIMVYHENIVVPVSKLVKVTIIPEELVHSKIEL